MSTFNTCSTSDWVEQLVTKNINPSTVRGKYILISTDFNRYNPAINIVWC